jgi:hypothetical protein
MITGVMRGRALLLLALAATAGSSVGAQANPSAATPAIEAGAPKVGEMAPDFALPAADRYGVLRDPLTLASLRGRTVVLAFFFKARTRG